MAGQLSWLAERLRANGKVLALQDEIIGANQTWQDKTATRSIGVEYTNNTGIPIMVSVSIDNWNGTSGEPVIATTAFVDNVKVGRFLLRGLSATSEEEVTMTFIVPVGATYVVWVDTTNVFGFLTGWTELRGEA